MLSNYSFSQLKLSWCEEKRIGNCKVRSLTCGGEQTEGQRGCPLQFNKHVALNRRQCMYTDWYSFEVIFPVALSCLFGLAISFFGLSCRRAISATSFTVLGIVNKLLKVVINLMVWDKHSTFIVTIGLLICMFGGVMYTSNKPKPNVKEVEPQEVIEEEQQKLLEMQNVTETGPEEASK
ncbi:hypothetical protein L1987_79563 [Smallanthus sonchifolius]|uniref:Uncharacterized protein n=1 Tax=Smallanthus sonchifolius TaxID=185202 RepID=A0ACB8ZFW4_9ASTR|nr:hypothetical protein L1987_79563 [Smallanthus sonchifolius]